MPEKTDKRLQAESILKSNVHLWKLPYVAVDITKMPDDELYRNMNAIGYTWHVIDQIWGWDVTYSERIPDGED